MPHAPEGIEWSLAGGRGQTLLLADGRASGSGGCNRFAGDYALDGDLVLSDEAGAELLTFTEVPHIPHRSLSWS